MSTDPNAPTAEDDFGKFFDNLSSLAAEKKPIPANFGASDVTPPITPAAPAATDPPIVAAEPVAVAGDPAAVSAPVVPAIQPAVAADPVVETPTPPTPAAPQRSDDAALLERLADVLDRRAPPAPYPVNAPQPQPARLYTDEEVAILQTAEKDYPDLMKALSIALRGATQQTQAHIFQEVGQALAPLQQNVQAVQTDYHQDAIYRAIPDYDTVYDPVIKWATDPKLPPYLRGAYQSVIDRGEVGEVAHLVNEWRKATGTAVPTKASPGNPAKPANELSEAAKQAAASLAPVVSRATAVVTSADPSKADFDGGWEWALKQK